MDTMWDYARNFDSYDAITVTLMTHGTNDNEEHRHYVYFATHDLTSSIDVDKFFDIYFSAPAFYSKLKTAQIGACRGNDYDVLSFENEPARPCPGAGARAAPAAGGIVQAVQQLETAVERSGVVMPDDIKVGLLKDIRIS